MPGNTAYCLSKGGMRMLTRTAGVELARHNILVVGVGPGAVATPINVTTMRDQTKPAELDRAIPKRSQHLFSTEVGNYGVRLRRGGMITDRLPVTNL